VKFDRIMNSLWRYCRMRHPLYHVEHTDTTKRSMLTYEKYASLSNNMVGLLQCCVRLRYAIWIRDTSSDSQWSPLPCTCRVSPWYTTCASASSGLMAHWSRNVYSTKDCSWPNAEECSFATVLRHNLCERLVVELFVNF
jgi:hypothetical protein